MKTIIIGRHEEKRKLEHLVNSNQAEFLAIYGRRRVGKTYLIREFFKNRGLFFNLMGQKDAGLKKQLLNFARSVQDAFKPAVPIKTPESWGEAFFFLSELIEKQSKDKKVIIFLDELPWLATKRSGLIQALDYEWNYKWNTLSNCLLIVCGSAASWIIDNLINAKGGLHNRVTQTIHLKPFTLSESHELLKSNGIQLKKIQILELYMVMGGIPFYLNRIEKGKPSTQMINELCFHESGLLYSEFPRIFQSLFDHAEVHEKIIREVAKQRSGMSRQELLRATKIKTGGTFRKRLNELKESGFISEYIPFGKNRNNYYVKIIDEYALFYLNWIEPIKNQILVGYDPNYWLNTYNVAKYQSWSGYSFEAVCMKHISQILKGLNIGSLSASVGSWRYLPPVGSKDNGAQIDLIIDRNDNSINLCEIKYSKTKFSVTKNYAKNLVNKITVFEEKTKTSKQIFLTMITTRGIKKNIWSEDLISSEILMEDLFTDI